MSNLKPVPVGITNMVRYPTLYARTHTGAVQIWFMEQCDDSFRSHSGQKNGAITVSDWTKALPKNEGKKNATTAIEQATAEIKAKYKKQLKSGQYWENETDIDKKRYFEVMLAKSFKDYKHKIDWSKGVAVQIKYNGERVILKKDGAWSRTGERFHNFTHIEEAFIPFFNKFPDAILDGEGFNYERREKLNQIHSLMSKKTPTPSEVQESKELIRFYIYDGYGFPIGKDQPVSLETDCYLIRKQAIDNAFFAPCFKERYKNIVGHVPTWIVYSEAELEKLYLSFLDENHEGAILRILGVGYEHKRTKVLLKYKPVDDAEFLVISVQDGVGKFANRIATVTCKRMDNQLYEDGTNTFNATFKGDEQDAIDAWPTAQTLVGKVVTIYYNGLTGKGKPNYARFDWNNWNKHN